MISSPRKTSRSSSIERENQLENWLNEKFPRGFSDLEHSLERFDIKQTGIVSFNFAEKRIFLSRTGVSTTISS